MWYEQGRGWWERELPAVADFGLHHFLERWCSLLGALMIASGYHGMEVFEPLWFGQGCGREGDTSGQPLMGPGPEWVCTADGAKEGCRPEFAARGDNGGRLGRDGTTEVEIKR